MTASTRTTTAANAPRMTAKCVQRVPKKNSTASPTITSVVAVPRSGCRKTMSAGTAVRTSTVERQAARRR